MTAVDDVVCGTWYIDQMEVDIQCGHLQNVSRITSLYRCTNSNRFELELFLRDTAVITVT